MEEVPEQEHGIQHACLALHALLLLLLLLLLVAVGGEGGQFQYFSITEREYRLMLTADC
jgi:hypothetical protein